MAYIGNDLQVAYQSYQIIDDISGSFNGSTTSFALLVGGVPPVPFPINEQQCLISVGGVIQEPDPTGTNGFRFSGSSIVFSSAPSSGEDFFGVILAGADYVNVGVNYPSGSVSAPSITFDTDLDTGIYNPAANELGLVTNGSDAIRIDSAGDVGINTSTPNANLHVAGTYNILKGFNRRPPLHRGPLFYKTAALTISIAADSALNGFYYSTATAVTMPGSFSNNVDYAIWQHPTTGALVADSSFTSAPAGATGGSIVGGFHHIPSGRPTAVNNGSPTASAEILEYSIWDLTWRPSCPDPRGMACVDERFWCDLYFCGSTSYAGSDFSAVPSSKIGLTIADENDPPLIPAFYGGDGSTNYANDSTLEKGCWYDFCEVASSFGKRLLTMSEFQVAAFGAPEAGSRGTDPGTVIWERASKWGLAQATGSSSSWGSDLLFRDVNSQTFDWRTGVTRGRGNVYQQGNDDSLIALTLGGGWGDLSNSGSRSSVWAFQPWFAAAGISARFAAEHLVTC